MVNLKQLQEWIEKLNQVYNEKSQYLTELDSAIGDADHGINMKRGFNKVIEDLSNKPPKTIDSFLKEISMNLIRTVGGASGPLYGTFFLKASIAAQGKKNLEAKDIYEIFKAGLDGVVGLGKAQPGEKTMIDTLHPAVESMKKNQKLEVKKMLSTACQEAKKGMESTVDMLAKKGRASYLGERSIGHQDPGATSSYYLLETASQVLG